MSALFLACEDPDALVVECIDADSEVPPGVWSCGQDRTIECPSPEGAVVHSIYAQLETGSCADTALSTPNVGPFPVGARRISVEYEAGEGVSMSPCKSTLAVIDTTPPVATPKTIKLWPRSGAFDTITIEDCADISDVCDPNAAAGFLYATTDEPRGSSGEGRADIVNFDCRSVELLAERKSNGEPRVYTLGYVAFDASSNVTEGTCQVIAGHDPVESIPADSGELHQELASSCE